MALPNFFVIGAPRSGSTSLFEGLRRHPQIYMSPVKEPWFFSIGDRDPFRGPQDLDYYRYMTRSEYGELFAAVQDEQAIGEASTDYLYSKEALGRIRAEVPQAKLIAILREPVSRAYSHFVQHLSQGREPYFDFAKAVQDEPRRMKEGWCHYWFYLSLGRYGEQLQRCMDVFPREQIKVILLDDLKNDPEKTTRDVYRFLGVRDDFQPPVEEQKQNAALFPKARWLHRYLVSTGRTRSFLRRVTPSRLRAEMRKRILRGRRRVAPPRLPDRLRRELIENYEDDITLLERLIDRDLSAWRAANSLHPTPVGTP